ncbi:DedA family protein [Actinosynnema sp.]|uniref:DedA family protein n=1 Tax=Actinosynnema sp. TaxID=1872144 RepID=UPI003F8759C9
MSVEQLLETIPPLLVYLVVGLVIGVESVGVPLPGEIVLVTAALMSSQHDELSPLWIAVAATGGAVVGDSVGYAIGRRGGPRLFDWAGRRFPKHFGQAHVGKAREFFGRHGAWAVFFGRFVALLRILAGPLAGSMRMAYPKFLAANAGGGVVWAAGTTYAVHYLGVVAETWLKRFSWIGLVVAVGAGIGVALLVRRKLNRDVAGDGVREEGAS